MKGETENFIKMGDEARHILSEAFASNPVEPRHIELLGYMISAIEQKAQKHADHLARLHKSGERTFGQLLRLLTGREAKRLKYLQKQMLELNQAEIDEYSDMALFLRALKAEHSGEPEGPVFTNSRDLESYLDRFLA